MDRISVLSDDLLVKILSFLPTKVAVSTCILSKRWDSLWLWLPKLDYCCTHASNASKYESFRRFLDRTLPLHKASVLESFHLDVCYSRSKPEHLKLWVLTAVFRCVRELDICYYAYSKEEKQDILPSSFYVCKSLAVLKLEGTILMDIPRMAYLPSLKTLQLKYVEGVDGESIRRFLSICPLLENLSVDFSDDENLGNIIVTDPSLQSLSLSIHNDCSVDTLQIDTPSLKYLKLARICPKNDSCVVGIMPKLEEAHLDVNFDDINSLAGSITSVKRLTLCSLDLYDDGFVFNKLEHLKLCDCAPCASGMLARLIKDSPNLRVLDIFQIPTDHHEHGDGMQQWDQPSSVPKCLRSRLQTFSWTTYMGTPAERDVALYILQNARRLKTVKISSGYCDKPKLEILKELSLSSRASAKCQLVFD